MPCPQGLAFHKFYFDLAKQQGGSPVPNQTLCSPNVKLLGPGAAVVSYTRLQQRISPGGAPLTTVSQETRVWQKKEGKWVNVHFHRSIPSS